MIQQSTPGLIPKENHNFILFYFILFLLAGG